jgi:NADH-quinone oxidoreductase subunit J
MEKAELILFFIFGAIAVAAAIMTITRRNPVHSVIWLVLNFLALAVIYLLMKAQFIAVVQVIVYMGAIMVLFLFVVMLLNLKDERKLSENITYTKITAILFTVLFGCLMIYLYLTSNFLRLTSFGQPAIEIGKAEVIGKELFLNYAYPIEIAGLILLVGVVGAAVLAKKKFE